MHYRNTQVVSVFANENKNSLRFGYNKNARLEKKICCQIYIFLPVMIDKWETVEKYVKIQEFTLLW
jgi:hypothetical protein